MDGVLDQPAGEPIIDVHLHAYPLDAALGPTLTNPATGAPGSVVDGSRCSLLFVDTSRSGRRRWCSMERCGNRAKVAAHRRRRKESDS
jgi:hypothetical protein